MSHNMKLRIKPWMGGTTTFHMKYLGKSAIQKQKKTHNSNHNLSKTEHEHSNVRI